MSPSSATHKRKRCDLGGTTSDNRIAGVISNGVATMTLTKSNSSIWTLSGNSTYTGGTTINGGTLLVNNTSGSGTGSGSVTVNGGTLGGTGTITTTGTCCQYRRQPRTRSLGRHADVPRKAAVSTLGQWAREL